MSKNYFSKLGNGFIGFATFLVFGGMVQAQGFSSVPTGIPGYGNSKAVWVDFDNDGKLDLSISGDEFPNTGFGRQTRLYRNTGSGFTIVPTNFIALARPSMKWFDADRDNDLDFIIMGEDSLSDYQTVLYFNNGGNFTASTQALPGFSFGDFATGDVWNHGGNDLVCIGADPNYVPTSTLFSNSGAGNFQQTSQSIASFIYGRSELFDADNDGDIDLLLGGDDDNGSFTNGVYLNNQGAFGSGSWSGATPSATDFSLGDIDSDGDLDFAICGSIGGQRYADLWENQGGIFAPLNTGITAIAGSNFLGDLDNDGDLDYSESGISGAGRVTKIYLNSAGNFTDTGVPLPAVSQGQGIYGDYDNDGALDLFIHGTTDTSGFFAQLFHNDFPVHNTAPTAPTGLSYVINPDSSITFSWLAATDAQTPAAGLTYSLLIGVTPNGTEITAPPADPANGFRRLVEYGDVVTTSWTLRDVSCANDYYFRVQAVDGGYMGSPFSTQLHVQLAPAGTISSNGSDLTFQSTGASVDSIVWIDSVGTHLGTTNPLHYTQTMSIGAILYSGFCSTTIAPALQMYVGITNPTAVSNIKMWPNPASSQLHITLSAPASTESVAIYDMQGRLMREQRSGFQKETLLSVEGLVPGLYLVKVTSADGQGLATGTFRKD